MRLVVVVGECCGCVVRWVELISSATGVASRTTSDANADSSSSGLPMTPLLSQI